MPPSPKSPVPASRFCTYAELQSAEFARWAPILAEPHMKVSRKVWEWCFIVCTLHREGYLADGHRGLGFGVGREPLTAVLAAGGATIVATDLAAEHASEHGWTTTGEHAASLVALNERDLCDPAVFAERVSFREVDMNDFDPVELGEFDFVWSSCAFEHLGSLQAGLDFVLRAMACVRPGGLAVHTTEYNVGSNDDTLEDSRVVLYRRRDFEWLQTELWAQGNLIEFDWFLGDQPADYHVDVPPYSHNPHLKISLARYTTTSAGLVIRRRA